MADLVTFDENGLQIATPEDFLNELEEQVKAVYGDNSIDFSDPSSQEAQHAYIFTQMWRDFTERIYQVVSSLDPNNASGVQQDNLYALNGIYRNSGTKTTQQIDIEVNGAVTLEGADSSSDPFTVSDSEGNKYELISNVEFSGAGTQSANFQCTVRGSISSPVGDITNVETNVVQVVSVVNSVDPNAIGTYQETDADFRIRRKRSISIASTGFVEALENALLNIDEVEFLIVDHNRTFNTNSNGTPGKSVWIIVDGGDADEIFDVIVSKVTAGVDTVGSTTKIITNTQGLEETFRFDRFTPEDVYIKFDIETNDPVDIDAVKQYIEDNLSSGVGKSKMYTSEISCLANDAIKAQNVSLWGILNIGISLDGITYVNSLSPSALNYRLFPSITNMDINVV